MMVELGTIIFQYLDPLAVYIQATERNRRLREQVGALGERETHSSYKFLLAIVL